MGEDYGWFGQLNLKGCAHVLRLREAAVIHVEEELVSPLYRRRWQIELLFR